MKKDNKKRKKNLTIEDEQKQSIVSLIGLFLIVYGILCFTSGDIGCAFSVPFTFLFGAFAPFALAILILCGGFMLISKRLFKHLNWLSYLLLTLILFNVLGLICVYGNTANVTIQSFAKDYMSIYKWNYKFIFSSTEMDNVSILSGGFIGYFIIAFMHLITGSSEIATKIILYVLLVGTLIIFFTPLIKKLVKFIKAKRVISKEKKQAKLEKNKANKLAREQELIKKKELEEARRANSSPITFNVNNDSDAKMTSKDVDDLLETTEINISGDDFNYIKKGHEKRNKLSNILDVFDNEIYSTDERRIPKRNNINQQSYNEVTLTDTEELLKEDVETTIVDEVNINNDVNLNEKEVILGSNETEEVNNDVVLETKTDFMEEKLESNEEVTLTIKDADVNDIPSKEEIVVDEVTFVEQGNEENVIKETINEPSEVILNEKTEVEEKPAPQVKNDADVSLYDLDYDLPPLYLLKESNDNGVNAKNAEIAKEKAAILMEKMKELNVNATINAFVVGPSVTRFEIALAPGVRVGSFTNLQEDFKLALGVNSIRIESPIPGKSAIGIEVPNVYRAMVSMKEIITSMPPKRQKLYVPVGKDITGTPLSFPICDMPHCLISGATNSGKSVCANTIILSLLMNYKPSEVRLIMVDPKRVEMLFYKDIPHLMCPIITESEKACIALEKLCVEMDKRFTTFSNTGVKNIATYNQLMESNNKHKMPFILLVVDEFAELMLSRTPKIVEERIQKLAQLGRAAGIHLILSTQRPDVNVIPGTIKTNLPCRMTFRLSSLADSRTVIDVGGAEKLLNNGDMLLLTPDFTGLRRVQGVYVSDEEISDVVDYCKKQAGPHYDEAFLDLRSEEEKEEEARLKYALDNSGNKEDSNVDPLYEEIKAFVIHEQKASTSYLIRKFSIGYGRAARIMDMLEENGVVGPENGSKPREVLISEE